MMTIANIGIDYPKTVMSDAQEVTCSFITAFCNSEMVLESSSSLRL